MTNPKEPAFPCSIEAATADLATGMYLAGLTKREYFAAMAMQGLLSSPREIARRKDENADACVMRLSIYFADALIAELNKGKP